MKKDEQQYGIRFIILPRQVNYLKKAGKQRKCLNLLQQPLLYFSSFYKGNLVNYLVNNS